MLNTSLHLASSAYGVGIPTQRKVFSVQTGEYSGRILVLFARSSTVISYVYADPPFTDWSSPIDCITDAADFPASGFMDENNNLYLVYTQNSTNDLMVVKLTYTNGSWTAGDTNTVCNAGDNYFPAIYKDADQNLLVSWSQYAGGEYTVRVKMSVNDGELWGSGPSDSGTALSGTGASAYSLLVNRFPFLYCLYTLDGTTLAYRRKDIASATWESAVTVYTGTGLSDDFHAAVSADHRLGVAFVADGNLHYKEFDGSIWSGLFTVSEDSAVAPTVRFVGSIPYVLFGAEFGPNQNKWYAGRLDGTTFTTPTDALSGFTPFDVVQCYDASSGAPTHDVTDSAESTDAADMYHPDSSALLHAEDDALYLGMDERFCRVSVVLSTIGVGGAVAWSFWNGTTWEAFTPSSGAYHFDASPTTVRLWDDLASVPPSWQKHTRSTQFKYWLRAVVTDQYSTPPVGSQITAIPQLSDAVALMTN